MFDEQVVLGLNRTVDASVCLLGSRSLLCSVQKERLTGRKHDGGAVGDVRDIYLKRIPEMQTKIDLVVECYASDTEAQKLEEYHAELVDHLSFRETPRIVQISHHFAHLYSAFFLSGFKEAAVMIIDFQGSYVKDFSERWPVPVNAGPDWLEVGSFYKTDHTGTTCIGKQLWDGDPNRPVGLGAFYSYLTTTVFPGLGNEGKMMGLAPYGNPDALGLPPLIVEGEKVFIPDEWRKVLRAPGRFGHFQDNSGSFEECADLAAAGQKCFEDALLKLAAWLHEQTGSFNVCFAGGTALNCVANGRLLRESKFKNVFIPPSPHDGGTALGCSIYGLLEGLGLHRDLAWVNDFTGSEPSYSGLEAFLKHEEFEFAQPPDLIAAMVELLDAGKVVGLFQGRSELGPRALGHRSILADPRQLALKARINAHVKGREWFRPLAPVVLEHKAAEYFVIDRPVPFMQYAVDVRPEYQTVLPAITHVDGTARLQTVSLRDDAFLFALLSAFESRTGIGVLLNTSFNGKNEPIVETPREAIECFAATDIDVLSIPPFLIFKSNATAS